MRVEDALRLETTIELSGVTEDVKQRFFEIVAEAFTLGRLQSTAGTPNKQV